MNHSGRVEEWWLKMLGLMEISKFTSLISSKTCQRREKALLTFVADWKFFIDFQHAKKKSEFMICGFDE